MLNIVSLQDAIQQVRSSPGSSAEGQGEKDQGGGKAAAHSKHAAKGKKNIFDCISTEMLVCNNISMS